jgi:NAD(P)-dependent dehydrogenase (short-subunit alcohol dehydrogenase family)
MSYLDDLFGLTGRVAVVTGASRGIGKGIASGLLGAGATCILTARNRDRLDATVAEFSGQGFDASAFICDVQHDDQIDSLVDHVKQAHGRIDILVNNAGFTEGHPLLEYPEDVWRKTIRIDLEAPFLLAKKFGQMMADRKSGNIINVTSVSAELGFPENPAYAASKGGLRQLTRSLAVDLAPYNVRVNSLGPGYFHTDFNAASWADPERRAARAERSLMNRWGEPEELAGLAVFIASDASSFVTGQHLYADGGWLAKGM